MSKRLEMLDKMLAAGSRDPFVWYARAMELRSLERLPEALEAHRAVEREFPDYAPNYLMAGQVAALLGDDAAARALWLRGVDVAGKHGDAHAVSELRAAVASLPGSS